MASYLLRRLAQSVAALVAISLLVFAMMYVVSDPLATLLPRGASDAQREQMRRKLGLDRPLAVQYGLYMGRLVRGDLGISYYTGRPVAAMLAERAPATIELAVVSLLISTTVGIGLGILTAARPRSLASRAAMGGSLLGISVPTFWLGLLLITLFAVKLRWLPTFGRGSAVRVLGMRWSVLTADGWRHIILPAVTLALYHLAMILRLVRAEMGRTLREPFIRVLRAKGLSRASILGRHALRHTLIPVVTVVGMQLGGLLAFSVVTETVFQWPGLGKLLIDSIAVDRPLVVAYLILAGAVFLAINFFVDLVYALIDPRIRLSAAVEGRR